MNTIPTPTYSNPLFSGSSQASHSPDVNLQYIWDQGINSNLGGWRPLNTGDLTSENQSINIESTDLDIRNLASDTDFVSANLQVGDVDVSNTNPVPMFSPNTYVSLESNTNFDSADNETSSTPVDLHPSNSPSYIKHGYIAHCYTGANNTFTGNFIFEVSMDNTNWTPIEKRTIESSSDTTFSYYDEFNFRYSRVTFNGDQNFTGTCLLQEKHDL